MLAHKLNITLLQSIALSCWKWNQHKEGKKHPILVDTKRDSGHHFFSTLSRSGVGSVSHLSNAIALA